MGYKYFVYILVVVQLSSADSDSKRWVWGSGNRRIDDRYYSGLVSNDRKYTGELIGPAKPLFQPTSNYGGIAQSSNEKLRYEVTESSYLGPGAPDQYRPERPIVRPGGYQPVPDYNRPDNYRPQGQPNGFRPGRPIENEYRPIGPGYRPPTNYVPGGYRPVSGANGRPILTGPVPSWEQHNPNAYRDYDKCKCVHSFNCNTPGIKFGSCDIDKQYCCYKAKGSGGGQSPRPRPAAVGPSYHKPRPVLAGPGGPVDSPQRPNQISNSYNRPFRPFSDIDRYVGNERDLDEAYKKGLESAIYELYDRPVAQYQREPYENSYKPSRQPNSGYGLYDPSELYGRSSSSNITAISDSN